MFCIFLRVFLGLTFTTTPTQKIIKLFYKSMMSTEKWAIGLTNFVTEKAFCPFSRPNSLHREVLIHPQTLFFLSYCSKYLFETGSKR